MARIGAHHHYDYEEEEEEGEEEEEEEEGGGGTVAGAAGNDDDDDDDDEDDWGLSSSSPSSRSPPPPPRRYQPYAIFSEDPRNPSLLRTPRTMLPSSPQCSMDDDSSTESEGEIAASQPQLHRQVSATAFPTRRVSRQLHQTAAGQTGSGASRAVSTPSSLTSSEQQPGDLRPATSFKHRRSIIKGLELMYYQDCLVHCRTLLALQRQWRQELDKPVPGLRSLELLQPEDNDKQKDDIHVNSNANAQSSFASQAKLKENSSTPDFTNNDVSSSLKGSSKIPLRRRLAWRSNEREAIRRGLLMFGLGRSEKVQGVMRGSLRHMQHGLGDIADCSWEFVRACSAYSDKKEATYVEKLLERAKDLGIELGPEVAERVGQWERIEKSGSVWLKRIRLLDNLGHVVRLCANSDTQGAAYNAIDSLNDATLPCDWWTRESDLALLAGVYKHGFGNYEAVRTDECFAEAFAPSFGERSFVPGPLSGRKNYGSCSIDQIYTEDDPDVQLNVRDGDSLWPDSNTLTRRLKRLVEHVGRVSELVVEAQKGSGRNVKQGITWSKREKLNFLRILLTWGLPTIPGHGDQIDWQFFKDQASVRPLKNKTELSLEACYDGLVKEMVHLLEGSNLQEKAQQSGSLDHEGSSEDSAGKSNSDFGEACGAGPAVLTPKSAVRLKERLELFDTLRQTVCLLPEDWRYLGLTVHQSHDLPTWWQAGTHDKQLVLGVLKHGFGNWDAIFEDRSYSFKTGIRSEDLEARWDTQHSGETDEYMKGKGKRTVSPGDAINSALPSPKSCAKRLKFIGSVGRRHLQKRTLMASPKRITRKPVVSSY